jgi:hypothetical protein
MNILMLAYEVESPVINELSSLYKSDKSNLSYILNADFWSFVDVKSSFYSRIYDENNYDFLDNFKNEYQLLNNYKTLPEVDYNYLTNFEKKYNLSLNEIIATDPILYTIMHGRDYMNVPASELKLKWVELVARKMEKIFNDFKPDLILTLGNNYFVKNITYHMSKYNEIKYLAVLNTRILDKYFAFDNFGINTPDLVFETMKIIEDKNLKEAKTVISNLNKDALTLNTPHEDIINDITSNTFAKSLVSVLKISLLSTYNQLFIKVNFGKNYFGTHYFKSLFYYFRNDLYRKQLLKNSPIFTKKIPKRIHYYYMALHVIPESAILTQSHDCNESAYIINICRKLPIDVYLVVKENIEMLGLRPFSFYKELSAIHNLILADPFMPSLNLTKSSHGVISICGTVTLEAALLNKRAIFIGMPEYSGLKSTERYDKYKTKFNKVSKVDGSECDNLRYVQSIIELGESIDMHYLMGYKEGLDYQSKEFKNEVAKVKRLLDKNYNNI